METSRRGMIYMTASPAEPGAEKAGEGGHLRFIYIRCQSLYFPYIVDGGRVAPSPFSSGKGVASSFS